MVEQILHAIQRCRELVKEAKTRSADFRGKPIPTRRFSSGPIKSESVYVGVRPNQYLGKVINARVDLREHPYVRSVIYVDTPIGRRSNTVKGKYVNLTFHGSSPREGVVRIDISPRFFDAAKAMGYNIEKDASYRSFSVAIFKWRGKPVAQLSRPSVPLLGDESINLNSKPSHVEKLVRALFAPQLPANGPKLLSAPRYK